MTTRIGDDPELEALAADLDLALDDVEEVADLLAIAIPYEAPDASVRDRLLASTEGRFARFAARMAELFDVTLERAKDLLAMADSPREWEPGPGRGSWLLHFQAGPRYATADAGFVKLAPGVTFPWHIHHGVEHALILQGSAADSLCGALKVGDEAGADGDTGHEFRNTGDDDYVFVVRVFGVDFAAVRPVDQKPI